MTQLIELEEDVDLGFDTQKYLPQKLYTHQGIYSKKVSLKHNS